MRCCFSISETNVDFTNLEHDPKFREFMYHEHGFIPISPFTQFRRAIGDLVRLHDNYDLCVLDQAVPFDSQGFQQFDLGNLSIQFNRKSHGSEMFDAQQVTVTRCAADEEKRLIERLNQNQTLLHSLRTDNYAVVVGLVRAREYNNNWHNQCIGLQLAPFRVQNSWYQTTVRASPLVVGRHFDQE